MAEHPPDNGLASVVLISPPFVGPGGWPGDEFELPNDLGEKLPGDLPVHVFYGDSDEIVPQHHIDFPQAHVHLAQGRDHQLNNDLDDVAKIVARNGRPFPKTQLLD